MTAATRADTANARDSWAVTPARLVWAALDGPDLDPAGAKLLDRRIGGVVLFSRNIASADALRSLAVRPVTSSPLAGTAKDEQVACLRGR